MGLKKPSRKAQRRRLRERKRDLVLEAERYANLAAARLNQTTDLLWEKLSSVGDAAHYLDRAESFIEESEKIHV